MAEAVIITTVTKLLSTIAAPAFKESYKRIRSIADARTDLEELGDTINSIKAVLFDAEKQRDGSERVKNWIERVKDVLYDVEDLFDIIATEDMLKQQMKGNKHLKKVKVFFSKQNPIASSFKLAKKVEAIRKDLCRIRDDIGHLNLQECPYEIHRGGIRPRGDETGSFVDSDDVIGRENEKQQVIAFLYDDSECNVTLISVVGIGGMGKTSLAQLAYNDAEIQKDFERRYWVCISDIFEEKEVLGKICQGMIGLGQYRDLSLDQLQSKIRGELDSEVKFLLVLDDLWDDNTVRGRKLRSLLTSGKAKGSKIIITTRMSSVSKAMKTNETLELEGLSSDASWELFEKYAFTEEQKNDPTWVSLGKNIVKKCVNVPLAIKSIACLLSSKDTIEEWRSIEDVELSKIELSEDPIMSSLRLSYDHLPLHLKNCFAYCSLYPKDTELSKKTLIYLWIAQGYVHPKNGETLETAGHAYFMEFLRRSFFQGPTNGVRFMYFTMHDLVHDLAKNVAGQEIVILTEDKNMLQRKIRHVYVDFETSESHSIQLPLLKPGQLRSLLFRRRESSFDSKRVLFVEIQNYVFLRSLDLTDCVDEVPESIGDLIYLRYLNLSENDFERLPDSITNLVNLVTLDITRCSSLIELPRDIGKLINLRHLKNQCCADLEKMPVSFGELTSLQHLDEFIVHGTNERSCGVDALDKMNLQGKLKISSDSDNGCQKVLDFGRISYTLEALEILCYPGLIKWTVREDLGSQTPKLERLDLTFCDKIKHITPLIRSLPYLKHLSLYSLDGVEYIEDEEEIVSTADFWPCLQTLEFESMHNLKGWSRRLIPEQPFFPRLSALNIEDCPCFESMPPAPHLKSLSFIESNSRLTTQLMSTSTRLEDIHIDCCPNISSIGGECLTSLRKLKLLNCTKLRDIQLAPSVLEELNIQLCENLKLLEHDCGDTLSSEDCLALQNLRSLYVSHLERLSKCLQRLVIDGQLQIRGYVPDRLARTMATNPNDTQSGSPNQRTNEGSFHFKVGNTISEGINSESSRQLTRDERVADKVDYPLF